MNKSKWYDKILPMLLLIIFSPLIILSLISMALGSFLTLPKRIKRYKQSQYYADFKKPYSAGVLGDAKYLFYNSAKKRNLPVEYVCQSSNGLEYFLFEGVLYLFPEFDQLDFFAEENVWKADFDGDWVSFEDAAQKLKSRLDTDASEYNCKIIVERKMIAQYDLDIDSVPECIFITLDYETAFENEDFILKYKIPQSSKDLYEMMLATPQLCGSFSLDEKGVHWDLYDNASVDIDVDPGDCYLSITKNNKGITHWHPNCFEIYEEVLSLGLAGHILVIRKFWLGGEQVLYFGEKGKCPYKIKSSWLYFEAK